MWPRPSSVCLRDLSIEQAIALPNIVARSGTVAVEETGNTTALLEELTALGHDASASGSEISGIHAIGIATDGTLSGAADPRREGTFEASAE